ncbi:hypothetical protein COE50_29505 [Bacillus anthracis]|nr:hypothetical protein COE50_29505 [Bacillus anthracis]
MGRDFTYLQEQYGEGAWSKFEDICYGIYHEKYPNEDVYPVRPNPGDGGIDVLVEHNDGTETIVQCKFFLDGIGTSQKKQINKSYERAIETKNNLMKTWVLCIPCDLSLNEREWWKTWKDKKKNEFKQRNNRELIIKLHDEKELIKMLKKYQLFDEYFDTMRIDKQFIQSVIQEDEVRVLHNRLCSLIDNIDNNDLTRNGMLITEEIDYLGDLESHRFFARSNLISNLKILASIVAFHSVNGVIRNQKVEEELRKIRTDIVKEFKKLFW